MSCPRRKDLRGDSERRGRVATGCRSGHHLRDRHHLLRCGRRRPGWWKGRSDVLCRGLRILILEEVNVRVKCADKAEVIILEATWISVDASCGFDGLRVHGRL